MTPPLPQGHRGQVVPAPCPQGCCCHILVYFLLCLNLGSGSGLAPPGLSQLPNYAWQSTHCPRRPCQALAGQGGLEKPAVCHPEPPAPGSGPAGERVQAAGSAGSAGRADVKPSRKGSCRRKRQDEVKCGSIAPSGVTGMGEAGKRNAAAFASCHTDLRVPENPQTPRRGCTEEERSWVGEDSDQGTLQQTGHV